MDNKLLGLMLQGDKKLEQKVDAVNDNLSKNYSTTAEVKKLMGEGGMAVSPVMEVVKEGTVTTVTITDAEGVKTFSINDGAPGEKGDAGSDATVTKTNIASALGYTPADNTEVAQLKSDLEKKQPVGNYASQRDVTDLENAVKILQENEVTAEDISELGFWKETDGKTYVDSEITDLKARGVQQTPLFANSIEEMTDTTKVYVMKDADSDKLYVYAYMKTKIAGGKPLFTNKLSTAIETDGTPYNGGLGYKSGYRINSSNAEVAATDRCCTGFIKVNYNDTIRLKNFYAPASSQNGNVMFYASDFTTRTGRAYEENFIPTDGSLFEFTPSNLKAFNSSNTNATADTVYMRISTGVINETSIVTINEEIKYSEATDGYAWCNTGREFVPADYEDRIIDLETKSEDYEERITKIERGISNFTEDEVLAYIRNWDSPIYDSVPVYQLKTEKSALTESDKTVSAVYAKYDALMAEHSDFITKTDLGLCSDGVTHVYRYDFREAEPHRYKKYDWSETKPTIIIVTGIHREWAGIYALFHALEEITTNSDLANIRRNMNFIVLPVCNPYALIGDYSVNVYRKNYNGVEIHRNFEVGHTVVDSSEKYYGGEAPLTEVETQYINNIMAENPDACYFLSCHSYDRDAWYGTGFMWASTATKYMCNMGYRLIDKMSKAWHEKYGVTWENGCVRENNYILADSTTYPNAYTLADGDYRVGCSTLSDTPGSEQKQATKYGIQALNLEVCDTFWVLNNTMYSKEVITHGAEVYINFFLTAMALYDHKDKAEYFKGTLLN